MSRQNRKDDQGKLLFLRRIPDIIHFPFSCRNNKGVAVAKFLKHGIVACFLPKKTFFSPFSEKAKWLWKKNFQSFFLFLFQLYILALFGDFCSRRRKAACSCWPRFLSPKTEKFVPKVFRASKPSTVSLLALLTDHIALELGVFGVRSWKPTVLTVLPLCCLSTTTLIFCVFVF